MMNRPILITLIVINLASTGYAAPPAKDVNVINTPTVNVNGPVNTTLTGTIDTRVVNTPNVNVLSMPPVQVNIPATQDVNVINTPGVTIDNSTQNPVPVTPIGQAKESVLIHLYSVFSAGLDYATPTQQYTIPMGKNIHIKQLTCTTDYTGPARIYLSGGVRPTNSPGGTYYSTSLITLPVSQIDPNTPYYDGTMMTDITIKDTQLALSQLSVVGTRTDSSQLGHIRCYLYADLVTR